MAYGMATKKVTVTLEEAQLRAIQQLVEDGRAESVSGFVKHAVSVSLDDVAGWAEMLGLALRETGGPLTRAEREWADSILKPQVKRRRKGKAA
jgi:Arc/MetJ-type ribon-helix-helix transcriptional regulator